MPGYQHSEIINPKQTAQRRMAEAEGAAPPKQAASAPSGMTQSEFTSGGPSVRAKDKAKKDAKFLELMRKHQQ